MWLRLAVVSLGVAAALVARGIASDAWPWLLVNLGLAWIPAGLGHLAARGRRALWIAGPAWLVFLPNAPYLLTDLVHLRPRPPIPLWFDVALLGGVGALGLAIGAASLREVADALRRAHGRSASLALWLGVPPLCGLAIHLGRFERWNSWDLVLAPSGPVRDVVDLLANPAANLHAWAFIATWTAVVAAATLVAAPGHSTTGS